jgi:hypothetical protein
MFIINTTTNSGRNILYVYNYKHGDDEELEDHTEMITSWWTLYCVNYAQNWIIKLHRPNHYFIVLTSLIIYIEGFQQK